MPNIYDVAKAAGVSRSTVSRVINNQKSVKDEKRQRVLDAIKEMNYTPNATARALAMNKTNAIGVIARELTETFNAEFISGIHEFADSENYGVVFCMRTLNDKANINYIDFLNKKVDGLIFIGEYTVTEDELRSLAQSEIPVIAMEIKYPIEPITYITIDNFDTSYNSIKMLHDLGHRRIVNFTADDITQEKDQRTGGYEKAVTELKHEYMKTYEVPYDIKDAHDIVKSTIPEILANGVTAAFCYNNIIAVALAEGIIQAGLSIPDDFSIIGFDDIHYTNIAEVAFPRFTSNLQPQRAMAEYSVKKLVEIIDRPKGEKIKNFNKEFKCKLMIHQSTGKAPQK
jgi:DNA-binding LacI/PurR family transcriptional regulator